MCAVADGQPDHPSKLRGAFLRYPSHFGELPPNHVSGDCIPVDAINVATESDYDAANDYNYPSADFDASYGF